MSKLLFFIFIFISVSQIYSVKLKEGEANLLSQFRGRLKDLDLSKEKHSSDQHLLRWILYYRKDLRKAELKYRKHLKWRKQENIDSLTEWEPPKYLKDCIRYSIVEKNDKELPILYWQAGRWDLVEALRRGHLKAGQKYIIQTVEKAMALMAPDVGRFIFLIDAEGTELKQIASLEVISNLIEMSRTLEENYPIIAQHAFVMRAPTIFTIVWNILRPLLSKETKDVISIHGKDNWETAVYKHVPKELFKKIMQLTLDEEEAQLSQDFNEEPLLNKIDQVYFNIPLERNGGTFSLKLNIKEKNSTFKWSFYTTKNSEIGFSVSKNDSSIISYRVLDSQKNAPRNGTIFNEQRGDYSLNFKNEQEKDEVLKISFSILNQNGKPLEIFN